MTYNLCAEIYFSFQIAVFQFKRASSIDITGVLNIYVAPNKIIPHQDVNKGSTFDIQHDCLLFESFLHYI